MAPHRSGFFPDFEYIPCFFCGKREHFSTECKLRPANATLDEEEYEYEEFKEDNEYNKDFGPQHFGYIPCFFCGKTDHFSTKCRLRPAHLPPVESDSESDVEPDEECIWEDYDEESEDEVPINLEEDKICCFEEESDEEDVPYVEVDFSQLNDSHEEDKDFYDVEYLNQYSTQQQQIQPPEQNSQLEQSENQQSFMLQSLSQFEQEKHEILPEMHLEQQDNLLIFEQEKHPEVQLDPTDFQQPSQPKKEPSQQQHALLHTQQIQQHLQPDMSHLQSQSLALDLQQVLVNLQHSKEEIQQAMVADFQQLQHLLLGKLHHLHLQLQVSLALNSPQQQYQVFMMYIDVNLCYFLLLFILCNKPLKPAKYLFFGLKERG